MKIKFIPAEYLGELELCPKTLKLLAKEKIKAVGLYASVQFCNHLDQVKEQLEGLGIKVITSEPKRTSCEAQLLGCDAYADSLNLDEQQKEEIDAFLYVGDGDFHPLALAYAQAEKIAESKKKFKRIICDDPIAKECRIIKEDAIEKYLKRKQGSMAKFYSSTKVGVLITTKPGQQQYLAALNLEKKYPDKKFYYFIDDTINFGQLENFPFIEIWINSACPRIAMDDQEMFNKGILNLNDI